MIEKKKVGIRDFFFFFLERIFSSVWKIVLEIYTPYCIGSQVKNTGSPMSVVSRVFNKHVSNLQSKFWNLFIVQYSLNPCFPRKKKTEKPWLNPKPKDELACQIEDKEGHDGYRHQEVELYFHYLIVCNLKLKICKQFLLIFLFFRIQSYNILIQQRNSWIGKCLSILRGGRWRPKDTYLSRALHIYEILCIYIYICIKDQFIGLVKWRFELERSICRTTYF